ncbi:ATP-binding protein [Treponema phagedenis]|uniref:ATP-binding protein n=1 Tax=Treponema phagedenis TaxID=162 RepID=A0AAE6IUU1_TREPH|nr:ATP-binding protein [Treponema phagedenis]NVP23602.1 ATP-binding protein [Treponema phagedenis]QEJ98735.1 ATP-binding protein [Treponema phagedenis]QEK04240.1 ATP-binding protein [Treponema phagedenis]QEK09855.1 ATP-binding protein [Treponema phagedenis]QLC58433.1 ATP-binding protein [Treponema phagedenis]
MEIKRDNYLNKLIRKKDNGFIKVITGIRRSGKSYLLNNLFYNHLIESGVNDKHIIKFAFDSGRDLLKIGEDLMDLDTLSGERLVNPKRFLEYIESKTNKNEKFYILLDEVQLLASFEQVLNGFLRQDNFDVYVTGSNSKFLSKDVITEFAGRGDEINVMPLVFSEFLETFDGNKEDAFAQYQVFGGLPAQCLMDSDEDRMVYLQSQLENVYLRDIVNRYDVRLKDELGDLLNVLASGISTLTNPTKMASTFQSIKKSKISPNTIDKFIGYFEDAFMLKRVYRYDVKGRKYIGTPYKIYFEDVGLRNTKLNFRQIEPTHLMENIIYNELRFRGYMVDVGMVIKRENDKNNKDIKKQLEVDFIANLGSKRYYIQSAYSLPSIEKINQEKASLLNIDDSFKKIIIVKDKVKPFLDEHGILTINLFDFLLDKDSLDIY